MICRVYCSYARSGQRVVIQAEFVKSLLIVRVLETDFPTVSIRMVSYTHNRTVAEIDESVLYISLFKRMFLNLFKAYPLAKPPKSSVTEKLLKKRYGDCREFVFVRNRLM